MPDYPLSTKQLYLRPFEDRDLDDTCTRSTPGLMSPVFCIGTPEIWKRRNKPLNARSSNEV